jgi:hypothetical protein
MKRRSLCRFTSRRFSGSASRITQLVFCAALVLLPALLLLLLRIDDVCLDVRRT